MNIVGMDYNYDEWWSEPNAIKAEHPDGKIEYLYSCEVCRVVARVSVEDTHKVRMTVESCACDEEYHAN